MANERTAVPATDASVLGVRRRLTLWYAGTFTVILLLLGAGLFVVVSRQLSKQLDASLESATLELARVADSPELSDGGDSALLDAMDALRIPQRHLYLLDTEGHPISPAIAEPWIREAAVRASREGVTRTRHEGGDDRTFRLIARPFRTSKGRALVAGAVADQYELEDRYSDLIGAFLAAAVAALILVVLGGSILTRKSMAPIDATIGNMRRFMADAAHELKTPIAILRSNAEVALQQPRGAEDYRATLTAVESESRRLGGIVEHMLILARADAGGRAVEKKPVYLDDIADGCVTAMQPIARTKHVALRVSSFEEASILADPALISDLIMILLDNAIKFTGAGGSIDLAVTTDAGRPTLSVKDNGLGIKPEHLPRIFERFYRVRDNGRSTQGAGLGLSIAKWIVDNHDARIEVSSQASRGTLVRVIFPKLDHIGIRSEMDAGL